ncbi:hypothetical protein ACFQ0K_13535 [Nocardioides caeni]|uniref:hypothetical protein n=1 Tax=Nocardioides caeni TaxID=574700 RepID=UPI0013051018|nr:hypothetical protein [Nocardioides caeni]
MRGGAVGARWPRPPLPIGIGWLLGGLSWVTAVFLPWRTDGVLSRSSLMDAARFVRRGILDGIVPPAAAPLLLAPALLGLVVVVLSGVGGRTASVARAVIGGLGAVLVLLLVAKVVGGLDRVGSGGWLAVAATALVAGSLTAEIIWRRNATRPH